MPTDQVTQHKIRSTPNEDRYLRCASCNAAAVAVLTVERDGVPVTTQRIERLVILEPVRIVDGQYLRGDRVTDVVVKTSVCQRHAQLHARRLLAATR